MPKMISVEALRKALPVFTPAERAVLKSALSGPQPSSSRSRGPMRATASVKPPETRRVRTTTGDLPVAEIDAIIKTVVWKLFAPANTAADLPEINAMIRSRVREQLARRGIREVR